MNPGRRADQAIPTLQPGHKIGKDELHNDFTHWSWEINLLWNKSNPFFDPGAKRPLQIFSPDVPNVKNRKDGNPAEEEGGHH